MNKMLLCILILFKLINAQDIQKRVFIGTTSSQSTEYDDLIPLNDITFGTEFFDTIDGIGEVVGGADFYSIGYGEESGFSMSYIYIGMYGYKPFHFGPFGIGIGAKYGQPVLGTINNPIYGSLEVDPEDMDPDYGPLFMGFYEIGKKIGARFTFFMGMNDQIPDGNVHIKHSTISMCAYINF